MTFIPPPAPIHLFSRPAIVPSAHPFLPPPTPPPTFLVHLSLRSRQAPTSATQPADSCTSNPGNERPLAPHHNSMSPRGSPAPRTALAPPRPPMRCKHLSGPARPSDVGALSRPTQCPCQAMCFRPLSTYAIPSTCSGLCAPFQQPQSHPFFTMYEK